MRCLRCALAAILGPLLATAPALAQAFELTAVTPSAPTWHDEVRVLLEGSVLAGCGVSIADPVTTVEEPGRFVVEVPVSVDCTIPIGGFHPVAELVDLGHLEPGTYTVTLDPQISPDDLSFEVYHVARAGLELPALSTTAAAGSLSVALYGEHAPEAEVAVDDGIVEVTLGPAGAPARLVELDVPLPSLPAGLYEVRLFTHTGGTPALLRVPLRVWTAGGCLPDAQTLCLHDGRFRVTGTWRDFDRRTGLAHAAPLAGHEASGLLWFFGADNPELTVKVIDGCALNGRWWVFLASGSTVAYEVEVTDTVTGARARYANALGFSPPLVADTSALAGCAAR